MSEKKNWFEVALMPLVITIVGFVGTWLVTAQQEKNSIRLAEAQMESSRELADADRQIKILEIFADKITNKDDEPERLFALRLLQSIDGDLATKLANAVSETAETGSKIERVAQEAVKEASSRAQLSPRVYVHIRDESVRAKAESVGHELESSGFVVPGIERLEKLGPDKTELRYFREKEKATAGEIVNRLSALGVIASTKYISGYEESRSIRQNHFELWFAMNEPQ